MEKNLVVSAPFRSLLDPPPDSKKMVANAIANDLRNNYPGVFIERGSDYIEGIHKEDFADAVLAFAPFREVSVEEIRSLSKTTWVISLPSNERMAYYHTQGILQYDFLRVTYRYINTEETFEFVTVRAN